MWLLVISDFSQVYGGNGLSARVSNDFSEVRFPFHHIGSSLLSLFSFDIDIKQVSLLKQKLIFWYGISRIVLAFESHSWIASRSRARSPSDLMSRFAFKG
jgi:hypothetical protein